MGKLQGISIQGLLRSIVYIRVAGRQRIATPKTETIRMNCNFQVFHFTISIIVFLLLINIEQINCERKCESEDEAFYEPLSKCFRIGESFPDGPCPSNLWFLEVDGNEGICECEHGMVFHSKSETCYKLNTQVSTKNL